MTKKFNMVMVAILTIALHSGCGSEDGIESGGNIVNSNNGTSDADGGATDVDDVRTPDAADVSLSDAADTSTTDAGKDTEAADTQPDVSSCPATPCTGGQVCIDGECLEETPQRKCLAAQDLGELQLDTPVNVTSTLLDRSDVLTTTCNGSEGGEEIYKFTVAEDAEVHFSASWNGQFDGLLDFRKGDCASGSTSAQMCYDLETESFVAEAGTDYYMVVEHTVGRANDYDVTLQATAIDCVPGEVSCSSETLQRCSGGGIPTSYNCADQCTTNTSAEQSCAGDSCESAIDVIGGGVFVGDVNAYQSDVDFGQIAGCEVDGTSVDTPGAEIVFKLTGVPAGQQFEIDAQTNDSNNNAIFITSNCGRAVDLNCVGAYFSDEKPTWTAPADGDYWVFIDKASNVGQTFHYKIEALSSSN